MAGEALALVLVCVGGGTALKPDNATVSGSQSGSYDYGRGQYNGTFQSSVNGTRAEGYADQVDVEFLDGEGRIRLPRSVLPALRGGENGWFRLRDLSISDRVIEAQASVNFINKPRVHIDRTTGTISINGMNGSFVGRCERVDPGTERQF